MNRTTAGLVFPVQRKSEFASVDEYLLAVIEVRTDKSGGVDACWPWLSSRNRNGYGRVRLRVRPTKWKQAHRLYYELVIRKLADAEVIDHLCRNRLCMNTRHMEPVSVTENTRRGNAPTMVLQRSPVCINGHPRSQFTRVEASGRRRCVLCRRAHAHKASRLRPRRREHQLVAMSARPGGQDGD